MAVEIEFDRINGNHRIRGFANLFRKESRAWWGTRRWWINGLLWLVILCGLLSAVLFLMPNAPPPSSDGDTGPGGPAISILSMGIGLLFDFGTFFIAIGTIVLSQNLIIGEKQSGVTEWLLSKPITRRAYILSKITGNLFPILILLIGLPYALGYGLLSLHMGASFPVMPFLSAVGIVTLHSIFYFSLTLMLETLFHKRGMVLGSTLFCLIGGMILYQIFSSLIYITPWLFGKIAVAVANGEQIPIERPMIPFLVTAFWCVIFFSAAFMKFEKSEL